MEKFMRRVAATGIVLSMALLLFCGIAFTSKAFAQITPGALTISTGNVAVPQAGNTILFTANTSGIKRIYVQCAVTDQNLDAFIIASRSTGAAAFSTMYSVAGDYTTPKGILVGVSGDLTAQVAGTTGWFVIDVSGVGSIRISASSANVAGSTVNCLGTGNAI